MNIVRAFATTAVAVGLVALPAPGSAASPIEPSSADQRFTIIANDTSGVGRVIAEGPFSGVGTSTLLSHTANPDGTFTDTDRFDFPQGQVLLSDSYSVRLSSTAGSCAMRISVTGSYRITGATGAFTGITGEGTFTADGIFVAGRDAEGRCLELDSPPVAFSQIVRGIGTFPSPRRGRLA